MKRYAFVLIILTFALTTTAQNQQFELYADNVISSQSATNFGNYLFLFADRMSTIMLYDMKKRTPIFTQDLASSDTIRNASFRHCNQCCFGQRKYNRKDLFPLLYVSQRAPENSKSAIIDVLRIITYGANNRIDSFDIRKVQQINLPTMTDDNCMGNPNVTIDIKRGYIYTYSRNNNIEASNYLKAVISSFKLPSIHKENVTLTDTDINKQYHLDFSLLNAQGGFYRKGKLFFVQGYPSADKALNYVFFREVDTRKGNLVRTVDMQSDGLKCEPEGCWFWKGHAWISTDNGAIYKLTGKKYKVK